jgi:hypothetical protein
MKNTILKRHKLLDEIYLLDKAKQPIKLSQLCKQYAVQSHFFIKAIQQLQVIKSTGINLNKPEWVWIYATEPTEHLAELILMKEQILQREYKKGINSVLISGTSIKESDMNNCKKEITSMDDIITWTQLGIKYGIENGKLKEFVKEGIQKFKKDK